MKSALSIRNRTVEIASQWLLWRVGHNLRGSADLQITKVIAPHYTYVYVHYTVYCILQTVELHAFIDAEKLPYNIITTKSLWTRNLYSYTILRNK